MVYNEQKMFLSHWLKVVKDAGIPKKIFASETTTLVISDNVMEDIMKIVNSFEESDLLINRKSNKKTKRKIYWHVIRYIRH